MIEGHDRMNFSSESAKFIVPKAIREREALTSQDVSSAETEALLEVSSALNYALTTMFKLHDRVMEGTLGLPQEKSEETFTAEPTT